MLSFVSMKNATLVSLVVFSLLSCAQEVEKKTILLQMQFQGENHTLNKAWLVDGSFSALKTPHRKDDLMFAVSDLNEDERIQLRLANPAMIRAPLPRPGQDIDDGDEHRGQRVENGTYMLRYPYRPGMDFLTILGAEESSLLDKSQNHSSSASFHQAKQRVDVRKFLSSD